MPDHAILSPSASSRWMACTPSARLEAGVPNTTSSFAREGTLAHAIAERILKSEDKRWNIFQQKLLEQEFPEDFKLFFSPEMLRHAEDFAAYVLERLTAKGILLVEQELDLTSHIEEGFGHMDAGVIYLRSDDEGKTWYWCLETFDLKYGKGVPVYAENNKQQMIYALGVLNEYGFIYDIELIVLHIYQPRLQSVTEWTITRAELEAWGENELKPKAALAFAGEGEFSPGENCKFCRVKATCKALQKYNEEIERHEFRDPALLTDAEMLEVFERASLFTDWIASVKEHILRTALGGKKFDGYKIVEGVSKRKYDNELALVDKLKEAGFDESAFYKQSLLGLADMEASLGKTDFAEYVSPFIVKPPGAPTLVPSTDKRQEFNRAISDFDIYVEDENGN